MKTFKEKIKSNSLRRAVSQVPRERGIKITAILIFALDQTLKFFLYSKNPIKVEIPIIKGLFYIVPAFGNPGIAFGLFKDYNHFFSIITPLVILLIVLLFLKTTKDKTLVRWGLSLLLTGTISNFIDRIIYGSVIDYLMLNKFPYAFNIADSSISIGIGLIIINILECKKRKAQKEYMKL